MVLCALLAIPIAGAGAALALLIAIPSTILGLLAIPVGVAGAALAPLIAIPSTILGLLAIPVAVAGAALALLIAIPSIILSLLTGKWGLGSRSQIWELTLPRWHLHSGSELELDTFGLGSTSGQSIVIPRSAHCRQMGFSSVDKKPTCLVAEKT